MSGFEDEYLSNVPGAVLTSSSKPSVPVKHPASKAVQK